MKKFLLLLVGVLFALSADAWTFYVDVAKTGWSSTSTPYLYAGEWNSTANNNTGAIQYYVKNQGTLVSGSIYKFDFTYDGNFDRFIISTNGEFAVKGGDLSSNVNKVNTYGVFFKNNGDNGNFKFNDKCFLVLHAPNTDGGADYYDTTYQIRGDLNGAGNWSSEALTFTIQDGKFICDASSVYESLSGTFKVYDIKNDKWYGGNFNSVDFQISLSTPGDNISISAISNPVFELVNDNGTLKLTITENSSTYYRLHGQIFAEGTDWKTQTVMTDNGDGTYSFEATNLTKGSFGIKELPSATADINDGNTWIRAAKNTETITAANTPYKVAYQGDTDNDSGKDLSSTLTGDYTIVFNKNNMTVTFVPKAQDYSGKTIAITGSFYGYDHWPMPVTDSAKKFTFVSGSTYTLDLSGYTFDTSTEFKIRDVTGVTDESKWGTGYGPTNENSENKIKPGVEYTLTRTDLSRDLYVTTEIKDPQLTLDVATWTLTITPKPVTPTTYYYRVHGSIFTSGVWNENDSDWYTQDCMTDNHDGTYSFTATIKAGSFGIKRLESDQETAINGGNTWINSPSSVTIEEGIEYAAQIKNNNGSDFSTNLAGEYTIVFNPTTMKVKIVSPTVTPTNYTYRFHSNMVNGTWPADDNNDPAWAMTKQSDGTWMWQGTLAASGAFGFKRLSEGEAPSKNNTWFYGKENNASIYNITVLDQWYDAKEKANFTDDSGHDWTFSPNGGTYQVIFDPANNRTKIVAVGGIDYKGRTYVISGTFNGWIAPADNKANCQFEYQETGVNAGKYVWSYTGLMKNLEFKISDLSNLAEDSDKKWGKAYGTTYTGSTRDQLTAGTETPYQLRRTNVPGEDVQVKDAELYNPTFILDPATMTLTVINNPVTAQYKYGVHSNFADQNSWSCVEMDEHADGSWSYTVAIPNGRRFDIRQALKNTDITVESNQTARVSSLETTNTKVDEEDCVTALVATNHGTKKDGLNWATDNAAFNGTTSYTIVFTPAKDGEGNLLTDGTGTLVIYNNDAVTATIRPAKDGDEDLIVDGQKANEIVVTVPVASYLGTSEGEFSLSMGDNTIATATAVDGNVTFEYLPYLSGTREFTLSGASKSVALNVVSPSLDGELFSLSAYKSCTLIDNLTGYADAAIACEPTATLIYDIPVWYYTINGYTYEAEDVYWSTNGFSFIIKNMVAFDTNTYKATASATAYCYGTPIFPFVVRKQTNNFAVDASNLTIQQFGGSKVSFQVTVNADAQVSGVEGVAVENEEAPVEYYNLQGQRVNGELAPGIYIRRQGTTVTKVRF